MWRYDACQWIAQPQEIWQVLSRRSALSLLIFKAFGVVQ